MKTPAVQAPASLLLDPHLAPAAKLVWLVLRLHAQAGPVGPGLVQTKSGLARPTILRALNRLAETGWCMLGPGNQATALAAPPAGACAGTRAGARTGAEEAIRADRAPTAPAIAVPGALLADRRVGIRGKVLYGILQCTPQFRHRAGHFTYVSLSRLTDASVNAMKRAVRDLAATGWLCTTQKNQLAPIHFVFANPIVAADELAVTRARHRLHDAPFRGEALMREYLSLLVDSTHFQDNAAPGFLLNPWTDELMQLDRFYPPGVAFEFNGPQHYGATEHYPRAEDFTKQRARDCLKLGICQREGIRLVVVHAEDLSLETMRQKVGAVLPLRDLAEHGALVEYLEATSRSYRLKARRGQQWTPA